MASSPPINLPELVSNKFDTAKESGALKFWATEVDIVQVNGIPVRSLSLLKIILLNTLLPQFQLRFCPALASKPKEDKPHDGNKRIDPFLDPPKAMFITEFPPSHILVLNKFAIVREHFILATKTFKKQTDLLEAEDLGATFACIKAWRAHGKELFAFFNSGEHSGASQPHRHIQLLPVNSMTEGLKEGAWKPISDLIASKPTLGTSYSMRTPH
jgi:ATP adenylyltransferase